MADRDWVSLMVDGDGCIKDRFQAHDIEVLPHRGQLRIICGNKEFIHKFSHGHGEFWPHDNDAWPYEIFAASIPAVGICFVCTASNRPDEIYAGLSCSVHHNKEGEEDLCISSDTRRALETLVRLHVPNAEAKVTMLNALRLNYY
jgi:hypothetical protein